VVASFKWEFLSKLKIDKDKKKKRTKKKMKKIAVFFLFLFLTSFPGCVTHSGKNSTENISEGYHYQTNSLSPTGFNEEVYVWEAFNFSTNRVEG
jgi:hypothetical protein